MPSTSLDVGFSIRDQQREGFIARRASRHAYIEQVQAAMRREPGSFKALYRSHLRMVNATATAFGPYGEEDDVVQEAFTQAFNRIDTLRKPVAFGGWLRSIAKNIALKHRAKRGVIDMYESIQDPNGLSEVGQLERISAVTLIRHLPDDDRDIVLMRFAEGMTYKEISEVAGISFRSVGVKLDRCKKKLKRYQHFMVRRS